MYVCVGGGVGVQCCVALAPNEAISSQVFGVIQEVMFSCPHFLDLAKLDRWANLVHVDSIFHVP